MKSLSKVDGKKAVLQLLTNEISICRYDIKDKSYDEMEDIFTGTNGTVHSTVLNLQRGSYTFYARCIDRFGNADNSSITFNFSIKATAFGEVSAPSVSKEIILCKNDGIKNYAEEGVDCGGHCKPCSTTTTVRTNTTTVKRTTTTVITISTIATTTSTLTTTTTLLKAPDIVGKVIASSGKRGSEIILFALIFTLTAMLVYYLNKGGKRG